MQNLENQKLKGLVNKLCLSAPFMKRGTDHSFVLLVQHLSVLKVTQCHLTPYQESSYCSMRPVCLLSLPLSSLCSCLTCINAIQARCGLQVKTRHGPELNHTEEQCGGGKSMVEESG